MTSPKRQFRCMGCAAENPMVLEFSCEGGYSVYRCPACQSLVTRPLPSADVLASHYAGYNERYTGGMGEERFQREMPKRFRARVRLLERAGARGSLLDLGGGNGMFARIAADSGFRVSIADFVPERRDLGFAILESADLNRFRGVPFDDESFDVVTLWSCIEHLLEPEVALQEMWRLTRPNGVIAVDTPLVGDTCERLYPARSTWVCPPEHLHLFSERGLRLAVVRAGFDVFEHSPFFERNVWRWIARRGRNMTVAAAGLLMRTLDAKRWEAARRGRVTPVADAQLLLARKPVASTQRSSVSAAA